MRDGAAAVARPRRWLGEPEEFQDPALDALGPRFAAWPQLSVRVDALFADKTMKELVAEGRRTGCRSRRC